MTTSTRKKPKTAVWNGYIERWHTLHQQRAKLDYETAKLAFEIRAEFPVGPSGDIQFRQWTVRNLDIFSGTAGMLLRAVAVYKLFDKTDWFDLGGWQSLQFLSTLKPSGRRKVLTRCRRRVIVLRKKRGKRRTIGYTTVRKLCYEVGVQQDNRIGRPNRLLVEENLGFVRNWLKKLYVNYELPSPPKAVRSAMAGTKLSGIADAAAAAASLN